MKEKVEESKRQRTQEIESERAHHQKLVKDYARLQQRFENLHGEVQLLSPTRVAPLSIHQRTASGISNISLESESSSCAEPAAGDRKTEVGEIINLS